MFNRLFRNSRRGNRSQSPGRGFGGGNKPGSGPSGNCICPKCKFTIKHQLGQRCMDLTCPKCGTQMVRE